MVARDWCIGGWKQRTCSTVELSVSTAFMYLLRMAKISLLRIWYFRMRSAIFFKGCKSKAWKLLNKILYNVEKFQHYSIFFFFFQFTLHYADNYCWNRCSEKNVSLICFVINQQELYFHSKGKTKMAAYY